MRGSLPPRPFAVPLPRLVLLFLAAVCLAGRCVHAGSNPIINVGVSPVTGQIALGLTGLKAQTFTFDAANLRQTWTSPAPDNSTRCVIRLWGAGGGAASDNSGGGSMWSFGGAGGFVQGNFSLVPGERLELSIGEFGGGVVTDWCTPQCSNGGRGHPDDDTDGGPGGTSGNGHGAGGGAASQVKRLSGSVLLMVAAGGGGAGAQTISGGATPGFSRGGGGGAAPDRGGQKGAPDAVANGYGGSPAGGFRRGGTGGNPNILVGSGRCGGGGGGGYAGGGGGGGSPGFLTADQQSGVGGGGGSNYLNAAQCSDGGSERCLAEGTLSSPLPPRASTDPFLSTQSLPLASGGTCCTATTTTNGWSGFGVVIWDVNECLTDNGGCDARTSCTNVWGNRTCGACPAGFSGNGAVGCTDINGTGHVAGC